jgi:hypothetical protein
MPPRAPTLATSLPPPQNLSPTVPTLFAPPAPTPFTPPTSTPLNETPIYGRPQRTFYAPLWSEHAPEIDKLWVQLQSDLRGLDAGFDVWIDWYQDRLNGKSFHPKFGSWHGAS